jgi:integration host factor subunit alpha
MTAKTVTRADLYEAVYRKTGLSRAGCTALVEFVFKEISDCLERSEAVKLSSFGAFLVHSKGQRIGRNRKTGKEAVISSRRVVAFKPSKIRSAAHQCCQRRAEMRCECLSDRL